MVKNVILFSMILESLMYTCRMVGFLPVTRVSTRSKLSNDGNRNPFKILVYTLFRNIQIYSCLFFFFFDKMCFNYNTVHKRICSYIMNNVTSAKLINNNAEKIFVFLLNYVFSGVFIIHMRLYKFLYIILYFIKR